MAKIKQKMTKQKLAEFIAKNRLRYSRGYGYVGDVIRLFQFSSLLTLFIDFLNRHYGTNVDYGFVWISCVFFGVILFLLALLDEKVIKFWHYENQWQTKELNPFFTKMEKDLEEIKEELKLWRENSPQKK